MKRSQPLRTTRVMKRYHSARSSGPISSPQRSTVWPAMRSTSRKSSQARPDNSRAAASFSLTTSSLEAGPLENILACGDHIDAVDIGNELRGFIHAALIVLGLFRIAAAVEEDGRIGHRLGRQAFFDQRVISRRRMSHGADEDVCGIEE